MNNPMENKNWREEAREEWDSFILPINGEDVGTSMTPKGIADWWLEKIESLLKSKQEEMEKAIDELPTMYTITSISGETIPLISKDDLKPIISNLLK